MSAPRFFVAGGLFARRVAAEGEQNQPPAFRLVGASGSNGAPPSPYVAIAIGQDEVDADVWRLAQIGEHHRAHLYEVDLVSGELLLARRSLALDAAQPELRAPDRHTLAPAMLASVQTEILGRLARLHASGVDLSDVVPRTPSRERMRAAV